MNDIEIKRLCMVDQLGEVVRKPTPVTGGLMHKMYAMETTTGKYAIKFLNPQIMRRPEAMQNYIHSERIANLVSDNVPALPAKQFNETFLQDVDGQFYLIFDWIEGEVLRSNEINTVHCEKMGIILADIHKTDFSSLGIKYNPQVCEITDWNYYLKMGKERNAEWANLLHDNIDKLNDWNAKARKATQFLATDAVISHRDLDSKNVLWHQDNPVLIDWESAGYINPMYDLIETAIYWSENGTEKMDKVRFFAFINGYKKRYRDLQANWSIVLENGFSGKLAWLEYNLKRSLWIECTDEEEQQLGTGEVIGTIKEIKRYDDSIPEIVDWMENEL